jgi:hypothetical protein
MLIGAASAFAAQVETLPATLLRKGCADPWLFRHDGKFYLTQTGTAKVRVLEADTLAGLAAADCAQSIAYDSASDPMVKQLGYTGVSGTWSPEIHSFSDTDFPGHAGWYMFLALRDAATGEVLWVPGYRIAQSVAVESATAPSWRFTLTACTPDRDDAPCPRDTVSSSSCRFRPGST